MIKRIVLPGVLLFTALFWLGSAHYAPKVQGSYPWKDATPVMQLLQQMGANVPAHYIEQVDSAQIKRGYEIITHGATTSPSGHRSKYVSRFYSCRSCHNIERENTFIDRHDPNDRLQYGMQHDLPYLQASTFWGIVNRTSWYNGDYKKKYGALVDKARHNLEESVQLCATACSQGRRLESWEMQAVLAYFKSLELTMQDVALSAEEKTELARFLQAKNDVEMAKGIDLLRSGFHQKMPATFGAPPEDKAAGYHVSFPDTALALKQGQYIYEKGCQHCHRHQGESDVVFDDHISTFNYLAKHFTSPTQLSIYEISRKGTYAEFGHRPYMPQYTVEKMPNDQLEMLRMFIEHKAR